MPRAQARLRMERGVRSIRGIKTAALALLVACLACRQGRSCTANGQGSRSSSEREAGASLAGASPFQSSRGRMLGDSPTQPGGRTISRRQCADCHPPHASGETGEVCKGSQPDVGGTPAGYHVAGGSGPQLWAGANTTCIACHATPGAQKPLGTSIAEGEPSCR